MPKIVTVSRAQLIERRHRLRRQRRWKTIQAIWRLLLVTGATASLIWGIAQPGWIIYAPEQVEVEGNEFLSAETVQSLLPISYPKSIIQIRPQAIAHHLKANGPIAEVVVDRQVFPPGLKVVIQERHPVAVLIGGTYGPSASTPLSDLSDVLPDAPNPSPQLGALNRLKPNGLIDENGTFIPLENYVALDQSLKLPQLNVIGMREQYQTSWTELYRHVHQSPVSVYEIDWQDPANLVLNTDLGIVHVGPFDSVRFARQLQTLDQLRHLPNELDVTHITYIDLSAPDHPLIQTTNGESSQPIAPDTSSN